MKIVWIIGNKKVNKNKKFNKSYILWNILNWKKFIYVCEAIMKYLSIGLVLITFYYYRISCGKYLLNYF